MSITRNSTFSNFAKKIIRDPPYNLFMISKAVTLPPLNLAKVGYKPYPTGKIIKINFLGTFM